MHPAAYKFAVGEVDWGRLRLALFVSCHRRERTSAKVLDEGDRWLTPPPISLGQAGKQFQEMEGRHPLDLMLAPDFAAIVL